MSSKYVLDTSAWIEYFGMTSKGAKIKKLIEEGFLSTSIICIAEFAYFCELKDKNLHEHFSFIRNRSTIIPLTIKIAVTAARLKNQIRQKNPKFSLADGIHLATAIQENAVLVTADKDFSGHQNVMMI